MFRNAFYMTALVYLLATTGFSNTALAAGNALFAVLNGGNEIDAAGLANAGDPNGEGSAEVFLRSRKKGCFAIIVNKIDAPTAAHIHKEKAGMNGPVVVTLVAPPTGNPGTSSDCVGGLPAALLKDIRNNPANYYINVHTPLYPSGAVRGQLF